MSRPTAPSPAQLTSWGLRPEWSRVVTFPSADGAPVTWHLLDTGEPIAPSRGTVVCVHGNPTWGYLWKNVLTTLSSQWRVIAVDQTGMGYSERGRPRRLGERIDDLVNFCRQEVSGNLVLAAHDWGGAVAVGAMGQLDVDALALSNTAVSKPEHVAVPPLIAFSRSLSSVVCQLTPGFVWGAAAMTNRQHRAALRAPYRGSRRRRAVRDFVADIPVRSSDPSFMSLVGVATVFDTSRVPTVLLWGGRDLVFHHRFLSDLRRRRPEARVERLENAAHLAPLDDAWAVRFEEWLNSDNSTSEASSPGASLLQPVIDRAGDESSVYVGPDGTVSWRELALRSARAAGALRSAKIRPGDRVAVLTPPSADLLVTAVAIWRCGAIPVVADASGGLGQLRRLLRASGCCAVVGTRRTLAANYVGRLTKAPVRFSMTQLDRGVPSNEEIASTSGSDVVAIVHTSGATGPAKAVRYTHDALVAQRSAVQGLVQLGDHEAFTTSFAAFVLLAPVLGVSCVRPDIDIDKPSTLGFDELLATTTLASVRAAWLSPAAAECLVATAQGRKLPVDRVLLAGAPISAELANAVSSVVSGEVLAPYGMTECLPITDGTLPTVVGPRGGTSTGRVLPGVQLRIAALLDDRDLTASGEWGEIWVAAPWMSDGYDGRDLSLAGSFVRVDGVRFHRTGDVGYLDGGLLFHLGRRAHVIATAHGAVASVEVEGPVAAALGRRVAAVAVGPIGAQLICVVVEGASLGVADVAMTDAVRHASARSIAAVVTSPLPVDHRHQSKIDRTRLSRSVSDFLAGR